MSVLSRMSCWRAEPTLVNPDIYRWRKALRLKIARSIVRQVKLAVSIFHKVNDSIGTSGKSNVFSAFISTSLFATAVGVQRGTNSASTEDEGGAIGRSGLKVAHVCRGSISQ